jgi:hypothetical protein
MAKKPKTTTQQVAVVKSADEEDVIEIKHLKGFQKLSGGLEVGSITGFFGPAFAGKSTVMFELGIEAAMALDGDMLVFDTESSWPCYKALRKKMERKFDVPVNIVRMKPHVIDNQQKTNRQFKVDWSIYRGSPDKETLNVYILLCPDIKDILLAHGRGMDLIPSDNAESGKMKAIPQRDGWARTIRDAPFYKFCEETNIKCVIYDSMTNPLNELTAVSENFPARTDLNAAWFNQIHKLAAELEIPVIVGMHESRKDGGFSKDLKVKGGSTVLYNTKTVYYILRDMVKGLLPASATKPKPLADDQRAMYIYRHPDKKPWLDVEYFTLTDSGMIDEE